MIDALSEEMNVGSSGLRTLTVRSCEYTFQERLRVSWQTIWQRVLVPRHLVALRTNLGYGCWAAFLISHASLAHWSTN